MDSVGLDDKGNQNHFGVGTEEMSLHSREVWLCLCLGSCVRCEELLAELFLTDWGHELR